MKRHLLPVGLISLVTATSAAAQPAPPTCTIPGVPPAGAVNEAKDVTYTSPGGTAVKLDVAWPLAGSGFKAPHPLVVIVHGGGWRAGDKAERFDDARTLAAIGYTVANVNYRLTTFPAQESDTRCAVRWIKAQAATYAGDPARIATLGVSAGAHLGVSIATDGDAVAGLDDGTCTTSGSVAVTAAVGYYGPYDLRAGAPLSSLAWTYVNAFLGCTPTACPATAALASPITHVHSLGPELLLLHGSADTFVLPAESSNMQAAATSVGELSTLVVEPGANHGYKPLATTTPTSTCATLAFLARKLSP